MYGWFNAGSPSVVLVQLYPLTAGPDYSRISIFYLHIKYLLLNMLKINLYTNQQNLKTVNLRFVKSV